MNETDREHLGGAGSLLRVPHQHGLYKVIKLGGPADKNISAFLEHLDEVIHATAKSITI